MADNVGGAGGGDAMLAQLLQSALNASQQQNADAAEDQRRSDAVQHKLVQKYVEKKTADNALQHGREVKETYTSERATDRNWRELAQGKAGPELMQFANQAGLQGKVSDKLKQMFLDTAATDPGRAEQAAGVLNQLVTTQTFSQVAPTARDVGELAARVLENPQAAAGPLKEAVNHPFVAMPAGDTSTKQQLARFASRQTDAQAMAKGASVRMAGDMLGTLAGAKVPGFAQKASLQMVERNPQNVEGMKNVDAFVQNPAVKKMPQMARGEATRVLAKGDGKTGLKDSLTDVAKNDNFRGMDRKDKARLFSTVGQGRAGDLRAITDKTLTALQQKDFPRGAQQIDAFLGGLARGVQRGARAAAGAGSASAAASDEGYASGTGSARSAGAKTASGADAIDPEELVRAARRGGMPPRPSLRRIPGSSEQAGGEARGAGASASAGGRVEESDEEAEGRQVQNRASLQAYFGKVNRHYERIEQKIKSAQYFEDVNLLGGLKEAEEPDLSALSVRPNVGKTYDGKLAELKGQLDGRQLTRAAYVKQLRLVQGEAFADNTLSLDERSYVYAKTTQAQASQTFQELSGKKHRKLREVKNKLMPQDKRRARLEGRRPQGTQPRFFRGSGGALHAMNRGAAASGGAASTARGAGAMAPAAGAGMSVGRAGAQTSVARVGGGAVPAGSRGRAPLRTASADDILREIDPTLSPKEQLQQAKEKLAQQLQQQAMHMASQLMDAILGGTGGAGIANSNLASTHNAGDGGVGSGTGGNGARNAAPAITSGKTNFYGVPQSFQPDLGANRDRRTVRPAAGSAASGEADAAIRLGRPLLSGSGKQSVRSLRQLQGVPMKQMNSAEANALRNLGWDTMSWAAQGQPGAATPTTYLTPFAKLRPLQKDSVRALGIGEDAWDRMVVQLGGGGL